MEGEQFSLCWNNFHSNLSSGFNSLLKDEDLVDVTLAAGGRFMKAHKTVLSVCSPFFKELFRANPSKHPIVILPDVNYNALCNLLQFMYQGEVSVSQEEIPTFMRVAEMLKVKGLTDNSSSPSSSSESNGYSGPSRSPYLPDQRQMMKRPQRPVKKVIKPVQPLKAVESPKPPKSPHPPPAKKPHIEESPRQEEQEFPEALIKPKEEPQDDTESNSSQKFEDNSMDLSTMLDAKLGESSKWSTPEINKPQDSSTPDVNRVKQEVGPDVIELENRIPRQMYERNNYFDILDEVAFRQRFRISKGCVQDLLPKLVLQVEYSFDTNDLVSPMNQLLTCLRLYLSGGHLQHIADFMRLDLSTTTRIIERGSVAIARLHAHYACFPRGKDALRVTQQDFFKIAGFPKVVGVIGCTHVKIQSMAEEKYAFYNRRGFLSINTQIICNSKLEIINFFAKCPGSAQDSEVFQESEIFIHFLRNMYPDCLLLGYGGYVNDAFLLTPIRKPDTPAERAYNDSHSRTREVLEKCIHLLKRRFPVLAFGCKVIKVNVLSEIIGATIVLHNICIKANDTEAPRLPDELYEDDLETHIKREQLTQIKGNVKTEEVTRKMLLEQHFAKL